MNRFKVARLLVVATCVAALTSCGGGESPSTPSTVVPNPVDPTLQPFAHTYPANAGPDRNPHKGWNSGWGDDYAEASVGFQYIEWKEFEPVNGTFDYDKVEALIARPGTKGRHVVLRLHCEWAGGTDSNCPAWMYNEVGVQRLVGDNNRRMTHFNDTNYLTQAEQAIQALAARYNTDPRVHAIQIGILGFWGEWHTHDFKTNNVDYQINDISKNRILNAYKSHFTKAPVQGRYPWRAPLTSAGFIGFHNDFFIPNNGHSNEFDNALATGGQWQNGPVGGEVPPRKKDTAAELAALVAEKTALFASTGQAMIETGHYTTMAPGDYRQTAADANYADYMRLHRLMGYNFRISQAVFADAVAASTANFTVRLDVTNVGVAPLYFPWNAEFALLDSQNRVVSTANGSASADIAKVMPNDTFGLSATLGKTALTAGQYQLVVRLIQPDAQLPKTKPWGLDARNVYIVFANDMSVIAGHWDANNALLGGWSVLGTVDLR